ncbi:hypothetical protein [Actinoplanes utahensis]|uniref:hypothetical protein n=1 Tax=Actinoplanes utahensis TaxID=1869 RepID=UPI00068AE831|nr:hypothetical protein [Actinoplanes utahensis]GIF30311.1 hypothetical protein Aut01nite_32970 [Actinoplanes utahensis]
MWWKRERTSAALPDLCGDLARGVLARDEKTAAAAFHGIGRSIESAGPDELTEGARRLRPALERVPLGNGTALAQVAAGLVEAGADPFVLLDVLVERVTDGLELGARFPALAEKDGGEFEAPDSQAAADVLIERVTRAAAQAGIERDESIRITESYFTVDDWIPSLLLPLQQKRVRQAVRGRERLAAATAAMEDHADAATWMYGLLQVIDDEAFLVIHRPSGRAYRLTVSGVGDNFQLHTLLAATLIGDPAQGLIAGDRPQPAWIAAATDGPELQPAGGVRGQFEMWGADGDRVWGEGRPADVPVVDGHRVVVLDVPSYARSWNTGRVYPLMYPEITLDRILPETEAAGWLARISGRENRAEP